MIKRDFNTAAKFFLGLSMFAIAMTIINSFMTISINSKLGFNNIDTYVVEIIFDVIILIAAIFTFKRKRYGLILLISLFITRMFATTPWGNDAPTAYLLGGKIAIFIRDFGMFAIAMCFRKNGISGWISMLASEEYLARSLQNDKGETSSLSHNENINIDNTETTFTVLENGIATQENECTSYSEKKQVNNNKKHPKKFSAKTKIVFISSIILVLGLFSCVLIISTKSYPEYISSFGDKWKHTFNIPNNTLSNKLFEEAINSRHNSCFFFVNGKKQFHSHHSLFYNKPEDISVQ